MEDLFEVKIKQVFMLKTRGYTIPKEEFIFLDPSITFDSYTKIKKTKPKRNDFNNIYKFGKENILMYVYYASKICGQKLISKIIIREFASNFCTLNAHRAIIISDSEHSMEDSTCEIYITNSSNYFFFVDVLHTVSVPNVVCGNPNYRGYNFCFEIVNLADDW